MPPKKFLVPKDHVLEKVLEFGNELTAYSGESKEFVFDFQGKGLDTPFGMLFLSFVINRFIADHPEADCQPSNYGERWYASYLNQPRCFWEWWFVQRAGTRTLHKKFGCETS
jgi:hypothetical protein